MLLVALFIIVRNWKEPNVLQLVNGGKKVIYCKGVLFSNTKEWTINECNKLGAFEGIMLNKRSQSKGQSIWSHLHDILKKKKKSIVIECLAGFSI